MNVDLLAALAPVTAALIGAIVQVAKLRRENTAQHADNKAVLERIDGKLDRLDTRLDDHGERLAVVEDRLDIPRRPRRRRRVRRG